MPHGVATANCRDITVRLEIALSSASAGVFALRIKVGWLRTASGFFTAEGDTGRVSRYALFSRKKLILSLILITGKLILIEFPINWLTMKVTNFVVDFHIGPVVQQYSTVTAATYFLCSDLGCIVLCTIGVADCDGTVQ